MSLPHPSHGVVSGTSGLGERLGERLGKRLGDEEVSMRYF